MQAKTADNRKKYLAKNVAIFTLGNIASKAITFFLVPFYTNLLSTGEYGIIDLITTICTVVAPILTMNIEEAVMRFALDKNADLEKILSVGIRTISIGFIFGIIIIPVCGLFPTVSPYAFLIYFYVLALGLSQFFLCFLRGKELLVQYSLGNILNVALIAIFNILFLGTFHLGIKGYILAYILAFFLTALYSVFAGKVWKYRIGWHIDDLLLRSMLRYSVVLIPNTFMWWIINSSDRVIITAWVGASTNGLYSIANKFPSLIAMFSTIFTKAWSYSAIKEEDSKDRDEFTNRIFDYLFAFITIISVGLLLIMRPFMSIYVEKSFYNAWIYTPYLIIGGVFLTIASFLSTTYTVHKDSKGFLFSGLCGAFVNIVLNLILIPFLGAVGAAVATCVSYIVVLAYRVCDTRKYVHLRIVSFKNLINVIILLLSMITMVFSSYVINEIVQGILLILLCFVHREILFQLIGFATKRGKVEL